MSTPPAIRTIPASYDAGEQAEYAAIRSGCAIDRIAPRALVEVAGEDAGARAPARAPVPPVRPRAGRRARRGGARRRPADGDRDRRAPRARPPAPGLLQPDRRARARGGRHRAAVARGTAGADAPARSAAGGRAGRRDAPPAGTLRTDLAPGGSSTLLCGTGADRATIYCSLDGARACWDALVGAGALPVGSTALETARIEDAEPCLERDFTQPVPLALAGLGEFGPTDEARVLAAIEYEGPAPLARAHAPARRRGGGRAPGRRAVGGAGRTGDRARDDRPGAGRAGRPDRRRRRRAGARRRRCPSGGATRGQRRAELLAKEN